MGRKVCLAIGVSTVSQPAPEQMLFPYLDGAVLAARAIGTWARAAGFAPDDVHVIDDAYVDGRENPVTCARVQGAADALFAADGPAVEHVLLAFCGHGLTDENLASICWLFSDSVAAKYRVVAERFCGELLLRGVARITLISDACRDFPPRLDVLRLDPIRGVVLNGTPADSPLMDRLAACQDGAKGYMVFADQVPGKCIFSGVVTDALWGLEATAIADGVITTASLGACVLQRTAERAREYGLKLFPDCSVAPVPAILHRVAQPPAVPDDLQPWPPAGAGTAAAGAAPAPPGEAAVPPPPAAVDIGKMLRALVRDADDVIAVPTMKFASSLPRRMTRRFRALAMTVPEARANLVARAARRVLSSAPAVLTRVSGTGWRVDAPGPQHAVLVEFNDGTVAPAVVGRDLLVSLLHRPGGTVHLAYATRSASWDRRRATELIGRFASGSLGRDALPHLVAHLSHSGKPDPVVTVLTAYLLRADADIAGIRRLAARHAQAHGWIPFDVALLGAMPVERSEADGMVAHVPTVAAASRPAPDGWPAAWCAATPAVHAPVGGLCPWLGRGWDYVCDPRPESRLLVDGLEVYASEVERTGFTVFRRGLGKALARTWRLDGA